MSLAPALPTQSMYTSCYCEENIYLLCQKFLQDESLVEHWEVYATFISNANKTVALWFQKAAQSLDDPVVWDYHVVLVLRQRMGRAKAPIPPDTQSWVYDFDTNLDVPCPWSEYLELTIPEGIPPNYQSQFRVINGRSFLLNFASDRSHMLRNITTSTNVEPLYISPAPLYPPLCGESARQRGIRNNLMERYVSMVDLSGKEDEEKEYGFVLNRWEANQFFSGTVEVEE